MAKIQTRILSSMEKVFPSKEPKGLSTPMSALMEETYAFQIALFPEIPERGYHTHLDVSLFVSSPLKVSVRQVSYVPAELLYFKNDGDYLKDEPGLFPDPLLPVDQDKVRLLTGYWNSLYVEVSTGRHPAKNYPIHMSILPASPAYDKVELSLAMSVVGKRLPKKEYDYTCWFHGDCLADFYHVPVFSEDHWKIMEGQLAMAAAYGQTMVLTPLFTPPLDTAVGGERTTIQLVGVTLTNGTYSFDFSNLDRFIRMAQKCGIRSFEMSHLYTQWGGKSCPKIMAKVDGVQKQIFGWDQEALSPEYQSFLTQFLPQLTAHLASLGLSPKDVVFHLTDEPHKDHLPQYKKLKEFTAPLLKASSPGGASSEKFYPIMDAMSDYDYFESGVTACPVVSTSSLEPFLTKKRPEKLWTYYCCSQGTNGLSNRFINMPGERTRILGVQLYVNQIVGFLQWGLNFYNSQYSLKHIDPFKVTDADRSFPSGDPFMIYPGPDMTPIPSQRLVLTREIFQDFSALHLLESLTSREHVLALIQKTAAESGFEGPITMTDYPRKEEFLLNLRTEVNREIALASQSFTRV